MFSGITNDDASLEWEPGEGGGGVSGRDVRQREREGERRRQS